MPDGPRGIPLSCAAAEAETPAARRSSPLIVTRRRRQAIGAAALLALAIACALAAQPFVARAGAAALLHPARRRVAQPAPAGCVETAFAGEGVRLAGWRCDAAPRRRGTIVYLHGIADNRTSARGVVDRFRPRGFTVFAYDSRAHGESDGEVCGICGACSTRSAAARSC